MNYIELKCQINPFNEEIADILTAILNELGFESFLVEQATLKAYLKADSFDLAKLEKHPDIIHLKRLALLNFCLQEIEPHNWNKEWEDHFKPIVVADQIYVRSSFHPKNDKYKYEIIIDPKMSFGTGHSPTTTLMLEDMLKIDLKDKVVLDMGCGTGILGIFASFLGAKSITGVDIDEWAVKNAQENIKVNNIHNMKVCLGNANLLKGFSKFDVILANINLNVLIEDIGFYQNSLHTSGVMLLSGFYQSDLRQIKDELIKHDVVYLRKKDKKNWISLVSTKKTITQN